MSERSNTEGSLRLLKRKLNSVPFELAIQHYYPLSEHLKQRKICLTEATEWDRLRMTEGHFFIPEDRDRWLEMCNTPTGAAGIDHDSNSGDLPARASSILQFIDERGLGRKMFSLGVGLAALEYHVKRLCPSMKVFCSDYSQETVRRLRENFIQCDSIRHFDLTRERFKDIFPEATSDSVVLLHRIDPHLNDQQWKNAFSSLARDGVSNLLFVPHQVLDLRYLIFSKKREIVCRIRRTPLALSGAVRTYKRWLRLWGDDYYLGRSVKIGFSRGFWLLLRNVHRDMTEKGIQL